MPRGFRRSRATMLVQIQDPAFDLSGDVGAIGRLTVLPAALGGGGGGGGGAASAASWGSQGGELGGGVGGHDIVLDLKGHQ
jgi:hypothetical protein